MRLTSFNIHLEINRLFSECGFSRIRQFSLRHIYVMKVCEINRIKKWILYHFMGFGQVILIIYMLFSSSLS